MKIGDYQVLGRDCVDPLSKAQNKHIEICLVSQ